MQRPLRVQPPRQSGGIKSRKSGGFMLVATLWTLAALVVLAAYVSEVADVETERAIRAKEAVQRELRRRSLENTLLYLLATSRVNHNSAVLEWPQRFADRLAEGEFLPNRGDDELLLTGEPYAVGDDLFFSLQDEGGLASVNSPRFPLLDAAFKHVGMAADVIATLKPRIKDYIDRDERLSLNGAETFDYGALGLPPPPNWYMDSPFELKNVLGVEELLSEQQWRRLRSLLTVRPALGYNANTMRPELLAGLFGLDEEAVVPLLEARRQGRIRGRVQLGMLTGKHIEIDAADLRGHPSHFLRMATWSVHRGSRHIVGIELTPFGELAPWRKSYRYLEPVSDDYWTNAGERPRKAATPLLQ